MKCNYPHNNDSYSSICSWDPKMYEFLNTGNYYFCKNAVNIYKIQSRWKNKIKELDSLDDGSYEV
jgi:hypothetical protein